MPQIRANDNEKGRALAQYEAWFKENATIPVSFSIGGKHYTGLSDADFTVTREALAASTQVATDSGVLTTFKYPSDRGEEITARHISGVTVIVKTAIYEQYSAFEWCMFFRNDGSDKSPIVENINSADWTFVGANPTLEHFTGDDSEDQSAMMPEMTKLRTGLALEFQPFGGRSTNFRLPFYRLSMGEATTVISVGWAGQWRARFDATHRIGSVHFTAGQATLRAYIEPNETIRTPMMTLLFADGRVDSTDGDNRIINLWRRFLIDCNQRTLNGELMSPHVGGSTSWIYGEMRDATDDNQIAAYEAYRTNGLELDYWWMDAGWYFKGDHELIDNWTETGTWEMDTNRFPSKMSAVSKHVARFGAKTLLWFEPERVTAGTYIASKPEWCVTEHLADMGCAEFREWLLERVTKVLGEGGISLYRQDYNIDPLGHWQIADSRRGPDRDGICENHYVQGYLTYWDSIIERFPYMMIDSCASGGRRNDLETMRRSVSLHKTDADYSHFTRKQAMHMGFYQWLPYFGTPVTGPGYPGNIEKYAFRSAMIPWFTYSYDVRRSAEENDYGTARIALDEWRQTNGCFYGDFYPLTEWSNDETKWIGWQFCDADESGRCDESIIQMFRRDNNKESSRIVKLFGLEPDTVYSIVNFDGEPNMLAGDATGADELRATGRDLAEKGLNVIISKPRSSALIKIRAVK